MGEDAAMDPDYVRAYERLRERERLRAPAPALDAATDLPDEDLVRGGAGALLQQDAFLAAVAMRELAARLAAAARKEGFLPVARALGARLEAATESGPLARHTLTLLDASGAVAHASTRGLASSGREGEGVVGREPREFLRPSALRERLVADVDLARVGQYRAGRGWSDTPAGPRAYDYLIVPVGIEDTMGLVALAVDLTPPPAEAPPA